MIPEIPMETPVELLPLALLLGFASFALVWEVIIQIPGRVINGLICIGGLMLTIGVVLYQSLCMPKGAPVVFAGSLVFDSYALFLTLLFVISAFFSLALQVADEDIRCGEVYSLTLLSAAGMVVMASAVELISLFLGLEIMSLAVYALAGVLRTDLRSNEASLKYFLLGAFSSALLLLGIAFCYGATGSVHLDKIAMHLGASAGEIPLLLTGMVFLIVGFGFKVAAVPFHMWAPDVYEGSPTAVTLFMATGVKAAGFAALGRVFLTALPALYVQWSGIFWILAVLTMSVGNILALAQKSVKRMLAYSSIAHAGYLLIALVAFHDGNEILAARSMLFYLLAYVLMSAGAFTMVWYFDLHSEGEDRLRFAGLGWRRPWLAFALALFLLSLAGLPPTAGFLAKFQVFSAAFHAGYVWLVILAVLNSLLSLYYYLRPLVWMYMSEGGAVAPAKTSLIAIALGVILTLTTMGTLLLGIYPQPSWGWLTQAAESLF